ncbi:MAG: helicase, partial [Nitrospira sp.]|nr:helicase [Nitrospira sp.]
MLSQDNKNSIHFTIGQMVSLKSEPSIFGAVIQIIEGEHETRYEVFHGQSKSTYYESQLVPYQPADETIAPISLDLFNARLTALQINQPWISSIYSLHAARVNFIPFQFKPVLKLNNSDRPNLLIADEVGVGKTIEAGLILRELQSRRDIQTVLVLCPKPLVTDRKWQLELKRFDEEFTHLDGPTLRYCINEIDLDGKWPLQHSKTIIPFSLFDEMLLFGGKIGRRRQKGLLEIIPPIQFDLVIIDEAHHLRNTETYVHRVARYFCENAESIIMLTATPIQLSDNDLYVLLNLLRPDLVIDRNSFEQMSDPNPYINKAVDFARASQQGWEEKAKDVLSKASATEWGKVMLKPNPEFQEVYSQLETAMTPERRLEFIRTTEQFHTFSGLINRTRRRDIGTFTTRKPETVSIEFTSAQRNIHDSLLELQAEMLSLIHDPKNIKFMMTTLRRQAASCIHGLAPLLKMILGRTLGKVAEGDDLEEEWDNSINAFREGIKGLKREKLDELKQKIDSLINEANALPSDDPKSDALINIIEEKQKMVNNKILIFSTFRHTLSYLHEKLISCNIRLGIIHGDIKDIDRQDLRQRFSLSKEDNDAIDVLLSSEVGCEGLDYQFCDCLINYDIPWNPMRVEQRIGRIDRYGQKSESIIIYNFITPDTV